MADNKVKFLRGTATEYEASTKDNDTFYYTTDDEKLYLGDKEITNGGGTSDVTKEYIDAQDATNLNLAKAYTDNAKSEIQTTIDTVDDTLNTHIADQVKHITAKERAAWNAKAETDTATTTADGLMSAADKKKLNGIAEGANKYVHPTTAGNKHIPSGGSKFSALKWSADGTAVWGTYSNLTVLSITSLHGFENGQEITATRGLDRTKCLLIVYHRLTGATDYSQINHFYHMDLDKTTGTDYSYVFNTDASRFKYKIDGSGNLVFLAESGDNSDVNVFALWFN